MITLKDVAQKAGVSEATVSLVLNKRPGVNKETRARINKLIKELGYSPNPVARSLAMKKTNTIGLVVTDIENPFFGSITRYISEQVHRYGYALVLAASNDDLQLEEEILGTFIERRVDGIIIVPTQEIRRDFSIFEAMEKRKIPAVFTTSYYTRKCSCVMTDYAEGSYLAAHHLMELGNKKIFLLVSSDPQAPISDFRIKGYKKAFKEAGVTSKKSWIIPCPKPDFSSGYEVTKALLKKHRPDAIMAINDVLALGAVKAVKEAGISVPEEISITGYDDVIFSSISETALTTIRQNIPEIAEKSVKILIDTLGGKKIEEKIVKIGPELVIRESTGYKKQ